jgi:integrase
VSRRSWPSVDVRENSLRICFQWNGKRHRETLKTNGAPLLPTARNIQLAHTLADKMGGRLQHGTYVHSEFFSAGGAGAGGPAVADQLDEWLAVLVGKAGSTLKRVSRRCGILEEHHC